MKNLYLVALLMFASFVASPAIFSEDPPPIPPPAPDVPVTAAEFLRGTYNAIAIFTDNDPAKRVQCKEPLLILTASSTGITLADGSEHKYKSIKVRQLGEKLFAWELKTDLPNYFIVVTNEGWGNHFVLQEAVNETNVLLNTYIITIDPVK